LRKMEPLAPVVATVRFLGGYMGKLDSFRRPTSNW